ncbi:MAG: GNAT family N-acetyltransferase [Anaerolineales bacterium]
MSLTIRHLESSEEITAVEELQKQIWSGSDIEVVPTHMLLAAVHGGGLLLGAYDGDVLVGFVFGFPGFELKADHMEFQHCSHMAGVLPDYRDSGVGFLLKRAQWQMVRRQGIERITWTYDPLQSRNAKLNIAKLGAVCNTYLPNYYGELRDDINLGIPSDRFQVDWWLNSSRVKRRLSKSPRKKLDLAHYLSANITRLNETQLDSAGLIAPCPIEISISSEPLLLLELPAEFAVIKTANPALALEWRMHTRTIFQEVFAVGYLVTDFVFLEGSQPRSYYVLSYGDGTL